MDNTQVAGSGGIGIGGLTFVVLLVLKITGEIQMSWLAVITSIIWAPLIASIVILIIIGVVIAIIAVIIGLASIVQKMK
ncbi:MAG: hypothetical protein ACLFPS_09440 [Clostridia bacterium]